MKMNGKKSFFRSMFVWFLLFYRSYQEEECYNFSRLSYEKTGNLTITGIFDANADDNCSSPIDFGTEEMAAAVWTVTALEHYNYLPGIKIGLSLFDACSNPRMTREAFAEAIIHESCFRQNMTSIGIIVSSVVEDRLSEFSQKLNKTVTRLDHILDLNGILDIATELLTNLHWTTVNRVIGGSRKILNEFSHKMSDEGICVYDEVLVTDKFAINNDILKPVGVQDEIMVSKDLPVIVVLCKSEDISILLKEIEPEIRDLPAKWLLIPTDSVLNIPAENLPDKVFSIVPLVQKKDELLQFLLDDQMQKDHMNHKEVTRSPIFVETAVGILELLKPFKEIHERHCSDRSTKKDHCPELKNFIDNIKGHSPAFQRPGSVKVTAENMIKTLSDLKIDINDNERFLFITSLMKKEEKTEDAAIFQIFDVKSHRIKPHLLIVNERLFNERITVQSRRKRNDGRRIFKLSVNDIEKIKKERTKEKAQMNYQMVDVDSTESRNDIPPYDKHPCIDILTSGDTNSTKACGICQNFIKFYVRTTPRMAAEEVNIEHVVQMSLSWRFRTWVAINASVAAIGCICSFAVIIFITFRLCRGDVLEGSPHFSFLILFSTMLLYVFTLPFSIDATDNPHSLICHLRIMAPAVGYSVLFSIMLSRSVMLIFIERDSGFINHVNGYLQSVLCFFMCGVQIALSVQFWFYNYYVSEAESRADCNDMYVNHNFIILMAYSIILLLLLAFAAPFIIRSKRNYKEGMFFSIATFLIIPVWAVWITFYYFLPMDEKDAAVALGLTGTATTVLLIVFIPRTYLMATAIVRDKITNSLPSLAYVNSSNISDINYRSNQALCDSATLKCRSPQLAFSKSRIYSVHMSNSAPASPNCCGGDFSKVEEADYVFNRRRTFIEVTRTETPENTYESYESPDFHGKITKF